MKKYYTIIPMPAPRLTRGSLHTELAKKYKAYKDTLRQQKIFIPDEAKITFYMPVPESKQERIGNPHQFTPDIDNLLKAVMDAAHKSDAHIWNVHAKKVWAKEGGIEIEEWCDRELL